MNMCIVCLYILNIICSTQSKGPIPGKQSCGKAMRSRSFGTLMSSVAEDTSVRLVLSPFGTSAARSRLFCKQSERHNKHTWKVSHRKKLNCLTPSTNSWICIYSVKCWFCLPSWWSSSSSGHDWKLDQSTGLSWSPWKQRAGHGPAAPQLRAGGVHLTYSAGEAVTQFGNI